MATEIDPIAEAPVEVRAFFADASKLRAPDLGICPLNEDEARRYSLALRRSPVGAALGLIALDDANDSNPYCYVSKGVARGMVIYFSHDPEPELRFPNIQAFRDALLDCLTKAQHLDDLVPEPLSPIKEQDELANYLLKLANSSEENAEFLVCTLLPLLEPDRVHVLEALAGHSNFFFRESVSEFILRHPLPAHSGLAAALAKDKHGQVARPALKALKMLREGEDPD